ncbi:MAG: type IX secretion system sortase PorU [Bacteroidales bacterium]|nr:type IX secretion system sortase PorU [Bacteroidales bacterium]
MKRALRLLSMIMLGTAVFMTGNPIHALPTTHYASTSALADGHWARVKVSGTGMHLITDAELRKLGFNDPAKVRVYGRGGAACAPGFTTSTPDDLPIQPSIRTKKGIVFFGADHITWNKTTGGETPYTHDIHPYSHDNYYFLSDRDAAGEPRRAETTSGGEQKVTSFVARLLHEEEQEFGGESGRQIFGEDFRTKRSQNFNFKRTDAIDDQNIVSVRFGAKTTNGQSSLIIKANGQQLSSTTSDIIGSTSSDKYYSTRTSVKSFASADDEVSVTIDYSQTGTLFFARLDYIEYFYNRKLSLNNGELHFYGEFQPGQTITISGCSASTTIWDVTDAASVKEVDFTLEGDKACFGVPQKAYREFIAFDPEGVSRNAVSAGTVVNQNIHGLTTPDMVIITLPEYKEGAERIAKVHEETDGFRVHVLEVQNIYNEFSGGKPDLGAFRNMLKMWYDRGEDEDGHKLGYCLLMGRPFYDNKLVSAAAKNLNYTPLLIYESYTGNDEHESYSTDDYIATLSDCTNESFNLSKAPLSIAVGRLPVTSSTEAMQMAEKIEKYVKTPDLGSWRNKVMIIADDDDSNAHFNQAQDVYSQMNKNGNGSSHVYDRIYLDTYKRVMTGTGPTYPQATERMLRNYNDGVLFTNYIGHGSPVGWCHEQLWTWEQINAMKNSRLTFILSATCRFTPCDESTISAGEKLMLNPTAGAIGLITTLRTVYVSENGSLNKKFSEELFKTDANGEPRRFGDIYRAGKNSYHDSNTLRYVFIGDPAIKIPGGSSKVVFTSINGTDLTGDEIVLPELTASSSATIKGFVSHPDGSVNTDFSGNITLDLYDAERVMTTLGQGTSGIVTSYNDRDKRLSTVTLKVKDGYWSGILRVPPEIQGNYSPALIAGYAYSDNGREAAGVTTNLYVYGFNESPETDTKGPEITDFYLNSPHFTNGSVVNSNPVLYATITDESGINISDSGIGHSMTLTIDDSEVRTGLNTYYAQDPENPSTGYLKYPIENLPSGQHKLTLTVWDNANNVSKSTLEANVGVAIDPVIYDITASVKDTYVDFQISLDCPNTTLECETGVFDLNGRRLWSEEQTLSTGMESTITSRWDMTDSAGTRIPRGIYIYRVTIQTPEGTYSTKSKKIAIAAAQ